MTFGLVARQIGVQVRQNFVEPCNSQSSQHKAHQRWQPRRLGPVLRNGDRRRQERPKAGGRHHSPGKAQHGVQELLVHAPRE